MKYHIVDLQGFEAHLPILPLPSGISIAFFNLHGNSEMTEHCGKELSKYLTDCEVLITAESKGLQLTHVVARESNLPDYAVARKVKKLYMNDGICVQYGASITTGKPQEFHLSARDVNLIKGEKVCIVDDVLSTGTSLKGLEMLVEKAGGKCEEPDRWGMKKYSYPINYKTEGYYVLINFASQAEFITELDRNYNIADSILRTITVRK